MFLKLQTTYDIYTRLFPAHDRLRPFPREMIRRRLRDPFAPELYKAQYLMFYRMLHAMPGKGLT